MALAPLIPAARRCPCTNTIEVLDGRFAGRAPILREANILISVRYLDTIAIVDPDLRAVVWALTGMWSRQHQPTFLDNGNLLLFDNLGNDGWSQVLEFDPFTQTIVWAYRGGPDSGFFTKACGSAQRLANGNTLITESDRGRAFEVTSSGKIVWEFWNPKRAGDENELIATVYEVLRLPTDFADDWLTVSSQADLDASQSALPPAPRR